MELLEFFARLPQCVIGLEACPSSHHWARELMKLGHTVKAMPPRYVKAYVKTNKNDFNDAEAICEAVTRPTMRFVLTKSIDQQAILHLHRARELYVRQRVALINHTHSMLAEYGIVFSRGAHKFIERAHVALHTAEAVIAQPLADALRALLEHLREVDKQIAQLERSILIWHRHNELSQRVATIPGIGPITATALVGSIGNGSMFKNGRELAAYLGLVPRQHSTGGRATLLGISKRGDRYLRTLLVHGARALIWSITRRQRSATLSPPSWITALMARTHVNKAVVAQAHKTARIAWAVLTRGEEYHPASSV
jgi:transposase